MISYCRLITACQAQLAGLAERLGDAKVIFLPHCSPHYTTLLLYHSILYMNSFIISLRPLVPRHRTYTHTHTHTHTYTYTLMHTHTHSHIHSHAHTHTHSHTSPPPPHTSHPPTKTDCWRRSNRVERKSVLSTAPSHSRCLCDERHRAKISY